MPLVRHRPMVAGRHRPTLSSVFILRAWCSVSSTNGDEFPPLIQAQNTVEAANAVWMALGGIGERFTVWAHRDGVVVIHDAASDEFLSLNELKRRLAWPSP